MSVGLSFLNEYRSEKAVEALHSQIRHLAFVERDGQRDGGRASPTSCRATSCIYASATSCRPTCACVEAHELECDESVLTGESRVAAKTADAHPPGESPLDLPVVRVHGDGRAQRRRARPRRAHGRAHGVRRDRAAPRRAAGADVVPAGAPGVLAAARHRHRDPRGLDLRHQRRARPLAAPVGAVRARDRRRPDAAAAAGDRDRQPGHRRPPARTTAGDRQAPGLHRGPRQRPGPVHGQDRHADRGAHLLHAGARLATGRRTTTSASSAWPAATRPATSSTARSTPQRRTATPAWPAIDRAPVRPRAPGRLGPRRRAGRAAADHQGRPGGRLRALHRRPERGARRPSTGSSPPGRASSPSPAGR